MSSQVAAAVVPPAPSHPLLKPGGNLREETVTYVHHWTDTLFTFKTTRDPSFRFINGQFAMIGLIVDNKPLALRGSEGRYDLDVSKDLSGGDAQVRRLERQIPYMVKPPNGSAQNGSVTLQLGIAPLVVDAPGESVTIEKPSFVLAGYTAKGATVTVAGAPITVDAGGRFAQVMNVSAPGETTIVVRAMLMLRARGRE